MCVGVFFFCVWILFGEVFFLFMVIERVSRAPTVRHVAMLVEAFRIENTVCDDRIVSYGIKKSKTQTKGYIHTYMLPVSSEAIVIIIVLFFLFF